PASRLGRKPITFRLRERPSKRPLAAGKIFSSSVPLRFNSGRHSTTPLRTTFWPRIIHTQKNQHTVSIGGVSLEERRHGGKHLQGLLGCCALRPNRLPGICSRSYVCTPPQGSGPLPSLRRARPRS